MKFNLLFLFCFVAVITSAQTLVYTNTHGNTAVAQMSASMITVNIDNVTQFSLPVNIMNTDPKTYLYSNNAGCATITKDLKELTILVFNPAMRLDFTFLKVINTSVPQTEYSKQPSSSQYSTTCSSCSGTGKCGTCKGTGSFLNGYTGNYIICSHCSESNGRICTICNGTGKWTFDK